VELLVRLGGLLATAVPAIWGLKLFGDRPWVDPVRLALTAGLIVGIGVFAWRKLFRRPDPL
jgi:hypothetical protein